MARMLSKIKYAIVQNYWLCADTRYYSSSIFKGMREELWRRQFLPCSLRPNWQSARHQVKERHNQIFPASGAIIQLSYSILKEAVNLSGRRLPVVYTHIAVDFLGHSHLVFGVYEICECAQLLQLILVLIRLDQKRVVIADPMECILESPSVKAKRKTSEQLWSFFPTRDMP